MAGDKANSSLKTALVSATELRLSYGNYHVLDGATLAINDGDKIGLVGRNGCGKSTFLKILSSEEWADEGDVSRKQGLVTGYLSQSFTLREEANVLDNVRDGVADVIGWIERYESSDGGGNVDALLDKIEAADGWNLEKRIETLMSALSCPEPDAQVAPLSGGEKRRVALCRSLASSPDLLLLDEPTNHLDAESVEWLETFLGGIKGACIFVTHDRYFLERVATRIVELDGGKFFSHEGNYDDFLEAKAERMKIVEATESKRQTFLRRELQWVRAGVKARTTKARSRLDNFYEIEGQDAPDKQLDMELIIPPPPGLGNVVVNAEDIGMAFGENRLFENVDLEFEAGDCTGIIGRNGLGKTTLLKLLMGDAEPTEGSVTIGKKTVFNYIDQHRLELDGTKSVFEEVGGGNESMAFGSQKISVRGYLKRFLFSDDRVNARIDRLSGGERSRVLLAKILRRGGNFLVLDEPTNDLDLQTLRVLEEAILAFSGCVLVVSHDRYFMDRVCDRTIAFEGSGSVIVSVGNYSYYREKAVERSKAVRSAEPVKSKPKELPKRAERPRKLTWKESKELEGMEVAILGSEERIAEIERLFADPQFFKERAAEVTALDAEAEKLRKEVKGLYDRWEELEAINAAAP